MTRRSIWAVALVVAVVGVVACKSAESSSRDLPAAIATTETIRPPVVTTRPAATTATTAAPTAPATAAPTAPTPSTVATVAPTTHVVVTCEPPGEYVATPSGRRALLRADGLPGPSPTIVVLHGYTGSPTGIERFAELTAAANASGIAVAYPEGTSTPDGGFGWSTGASVFATDGVDDVTALAELLDVLVPTGCVDPARVVLVGESNGGGMALLAACSPRLAGRLARVVLVNAAVDGGVLERPCAVTSAPLTAVAGAIDETVPLAGDEVLRPVADWFAAVAMTLGGCGSVAAAPPVDAKVSRLVGTGCAACNELLVVADGTHTWPGSSRGVNDLVPGTLDLNGLLVSASMATTSGCLTGLP